MTAYRDTGTRPPDPPEHLRGKSDLKLVSYVWYCGDTECDCTEPVIAWQWTEQTSTSIKSYHREAVWTGTFISHGYGTDPDDPDPDEELAAAKTALGIVP